MCDCERICIPEVIATVISATEADGAAVLTINKTLTELSWFRLHVPCAIISGLAGTDTVSFTDGTNTYTAQNWIGNLLQINTLKKVFCKHACCCDCCSCTDTLTAVVGNNPVHVSVVTRVI